MTIQQEYAGRMRTLERIQERRAAMEVLPIAARYTTDAGQSIAHNTVTIVNFEDRDFDTRAAVTPGAAWEFEAPVGGYYQVNVAITFEPSTQFDNAEELSLYLYVDGGEVSRIFTHASWGTATQEAGACGSDCIHLGQGEKLDIRVHHKTGNTSSLNSAGNDNYVSIFRVSA